MNPFKNLIPYFFKVICFRYHDRIVCKLYCVPEPLFHSRWIHFYISLTKKSLKWGPFVAMRRHWNITILLKIWMWWFPAQEWSLWLPAALSFGSLLAEAWFWPPNPSSLRVTGCIYAPLRTYTLCRVKKLTCFCYFLHFWSKYPHHCSFNMHHITLF